MLSIRSLTLGLVLPLAWVACSGAPEPTTPSEASRPAAPSDRSAALTEPGELLPVVELRVRDFGTMQIELFVHEAPETVASFLELATEGFYAGTTFHRVVPGFMIQGGDPNSKNRDPRDDGQGGPGFTLPDEFNDVPLRRGTVSMAQTGRPDSAGSQFFILIDDQPELDGSYTAFGRVIAGIEVADAIAEVERDQYGRHGPHDRPLKNVVIEEIELVAAPRSS
jgi:peptidyl-prolyl cis-trans isomerase B (cyclophilin B)